MVSITAAILDDYTPWGYAHEHDEHEDTWLHDIQGAAAGAAGASRGTGAGRAPDGRGRPLLHRRPHPDRGGPGGAQQDRARPRRRPRPPLHGRRQGRLRGAGGGADGRGRAAGQLVRILVAGATGRFGAIAELLLARGHRVRAGARNLDSPRAERLRERGAELAFADFDAPTSLTVAAGGVDAVFASGTAHRVGPEGEVRHGANLVQALEAAQTPHLVFVSGDGAAADSPVPLFRAKWRVENEIRAAGIPHTILAPTYLMENLFNPWNIEPLRAGVFSSPVPIAQPPQQT